MDTNISTTTTTTTIKSSNETTTTSIISSTVAVNTIASSNTTGTDNDVIMIKNDDSITKQHDRHENDNDNPIPFTTTLEENTKTSNKNDVLDNIHPPPSSKKYENDENDADNDHCCGETQPTTNEVVGEVKVEGADDNFVVVDEKVKNDSNNNNNNNIKIEDRHDNNDDSDAVIAKNFLDISVENILPTKKRIRKSIITTTSTTGSTSQRNSNNNNINHHDTTKNNTKTDDDIDDNDHDDIDEGVDDEENVCKKDGETMMIKFRNFLDISNENILPESKRRKRITIRTTTATTTTTPERTRTTTTNTNMNSIIPDTTVSTTIVEIDQTRNNNTNNNNSRSSRKNNTPRNTKIQMEQQKQKPKKKEKDTETLFQTSWICSECKEAECLMSNSTHKKNDENGNNVVVVEEEEEDTADELLICDGPCMRLFHWPCAGLNQLPLPNEEFICNDCMKYTHQCTICQLYGKDDEDVYKCIKSACGLFYHESCLELWNVSVKRILSPSTTTATPQSPSKEKQQQKQQKQSVPVTPPRPLLQSDLDDENVDMIEKNNQSSNNCNMELQEQEQLIKMEPDQTTSTITYDPANTTTTTGNDTITKLIFSCPAHACWSCTQIDLKVETTNTATIGTTSCNTSVTTSNKKGGKKKVLTSKQKVGSFECKRDTLLFRCLVCPIAFHMSCIPPSAKFHELALLCHEHSGSYPLPQLNLEDSLQNMIEKQIDVKFASSLKAIDGANKKDKNDERVSKNFRKKNGSRNKFFPNLVGTKQTKQEIQLLEKLQNQFDDYHDKSLFFCLPCDFKDEVQKILPSYKHIHNNLYDPIKKPPKVISSGLERCECDPDKTERCGDSCLNRSLYVECYGDIHDPKCKSSNCKFGLNCGNRLFSQRKFIRCQPKREEGKGWGLTVTQNVNQGELIIEYVGEIIDSSMKVQRLLEWSIQHPNDPNFYIMALQSGWFLDARMKGNLSRFVNHSCEPNCMIIPVNVTGRIRCGIIANREIVAGEFLSYDYHFDTVDGDKFVCRCGSSKCRGTMKGNNNSHQKSLLRNSPTSGLKTSKNDLYEAAKIAYEKDKKFVNDYYEDTIRRSNLVRETVPGDEIMINTNYTSSNSTNNNNHYNNNNNINNNLNSSNSNNNHGTGSTNTKSSYSETELVANGPQNKYRSLVQKSTLFLWRNVEIGADFDQRFRRKQQKQQLQSQQQQEQR